MKKLSTYRVGYWLEQGFEISVEATSAKNAERLVRKSLNLVSDELPGSERVHYDDGICSVDVVSTGGAS